MRTRLSAQRGSALLIVLGLVSFIVISAVAFSAYMRSSRLPSSYLRRSIASRMLVKAALAEAIEEIDAAIGDNPHPGVGNSNTFLARNGGNYNNWIGRVYVGGGSNAANLVAPISTVPTLSLEGLAYIPPALVANARYYSRKSSAAKWHTLDFDAGRYAFCALDVSDYFDVNALSANKARNSSPGGRVSLSYLFENEAHTSAGSSGAVQWDSFIAAKTRNVPFVSLADWNLALHDNGKIGEFESFFGKFVTGGSSQDFYGSTETNVIAKMTFVTDGWFPEDKTVRVDSQNSYEVYDLSIEENQPFTKAFLEASKPNLPQIISGQGGAKQEVSNALAEYICPMGFVTLYDYLDPDKVPTSLVIPTAERVPMVCSIAPDIRPQNLEIVEVKGAETTQGGGKTRTITRTVKYSLKGLQGIKNMSQVQLLFLYPFRHADKVSDTFKFDGRMALFLTREGESPLGLRVPQSAQCKLLQGGRKDLFESSRAENSVYNVVFAKNKGVAVPKEIETEEDALISTVCTGLDDASAIPSNLDLFEVTYQWQQTVDESGNATPENPTSLASIVDAKCLMKPIGSNGSETEIADFVGKLRSGNAADLKLNLNLALWTRVKYASGNDGFTDSDATVDLAPAALADDKEMNGINNTSFGSVLGVGNSHPVLKFRTNLTLNYALAASGGKISLVEPNPPTSIEANPKAAMVGDPRFNHAPESWFGCTGVSKTDWLANCGRAGAGKDGDVFMSISDQGYLQSIYELCHLPRLCGFAVNGGSNTRVSGDYVNPDGFASVLPDSFGGAANSALMWRTYSPFGGDDFRDSEFVSSGNGFKVNPYSDSINVLMAALANTPHDWRVASTNNQEEAFEELSASEFNRAYAWNEYSSGAQIRWEALEDVASELSAAVRGGTNFEDAWRDLGWNSDRNYILDCGDVQLDDPLYSSDKKFLYGFWHDCFAAKQQLFLVFVRAEPLMMGGGLANQTPPQLGARAVALVWRDPVSRNPDAPHRTRVLFYKQLD